MKGRALQRDARNGHYYVKIRCNGVRQYFPLGSHKKEAQRQLKRIERDIAAGKISFTKEETTATTVDGHRDIEVAELAKRHLEWVKVNRADGTYKLRQAYAFQFLEFLGVGTMVDGRFQITGSKLVSEITRNDMTNFHLWAKQNSHSQSPNAGNQSLRQVKTMLLWGVDEELYKLTFRKFPTISTEPAPTKRIDSKHLAVFMEKAPADLVDMVKFGLSTNLRPKELRELTKEQIVRKEDGIWYVRIERHKTAGSTRETSVRTIPLTARAKEIVDRHIGAHPKSKYIFLNGSGTRYDRTVFRNRLIRWCKRIGIPNITPYALRHTSLSLCSDAGVETTALARLAGHSTVRTLSRYVSNSSEHDLHAVQAGEAALDEALRNA